jgi:hypothetical protein
MRIAAVIAILAASLALTTTGRAATVYFDATLSGIASGGVGGGPSGYWSFSGRANVPSIGVVSFEGTYQISCLEPGDVYPPPCTRELELTLTTASGDTLVLSGRNDWLNGDPVPVGTWTASEGSGRLASCTGSGSYSLDTDDPWRFMGTVVLAGSLTK